MDWLSLCRGGFLALSEIVYVEVTAGLSQLSWVSTANARTGAGKRLHWGKMRITWVRRRISSLRRSSVKASRIAGKRVRMHPA
jgi:hypothetical protein